MDNRLRKDILNLKKNKDELLLHKIYREISCVLKQNLFGAPKQFQRDIIVLCAEEAVKLKRNDVSNNCLDMFFKTSPPGDTWMCRAILCRVKLLSENNALTLESFENISSWVIKFFGIITSKPRLHSHGLEMCFLLLCCSQSFMRGGLYRHLEKCLRCVVDFFEVVREPDLTWKAAVHMHYINSLLDDKTRRNEADDFLVKSFPLITENAIEHRLHLMMLAIDRKLDKNLLDVLESQPELGILHRICLYRRATDKESLPYGLEDLFRDSMELMPMERKHMIETNRTYLLLNLCMLSLDEKELKISRGCISRLRDSPRFEMEEEFRLKVELFDLEWEFQELEVKGRVLSKSSVEERLAMLNCCTSILKAASSSPSSSSSSPYILQLGSVIMWNACKPLLQPSLRSKVKQHLVFVLWLLCSSGSRMEDVECQVSFELSKCCRDDDDIAQAICYVDKALENDKGKYRELLEMFKRRLILCNSVEDFDRAEDKAAQLLEHARTTSTCPAPVDRSVLTEVGTTMAPYIFEETLDAFFTWNDLRGVTDVESALKEVAQKVTNYRSWEVRSAEYFNDLDTGNDLERMMIWADLAKLSKLRNQWDLCRVASTFCLAYDDDRWCQLFEDQLSVSNYSSKFSKNQPADQVRKSKLGVPKKEASRLSPANKADPQKSIIHDNLGDNMWKASDPKRSMEELEATTIDTTEEKLSSVVHGDLLWREALRTLAEVRLIRGESFLHLLNSEGVCLGSEDSCIIRTPGLNCCPTDYNRLPEWISYVNYLKDLSRRGIEDFLRAGGLGLTLGDGWLVEGACVELWNHHRGAVVRGNFDAIVANFVPMYKILEFCDQPINPELLMNLASQIAISSAELKKQEQLESVERTKEASSSIKNVASKSGSKVAPRKKSNRSDEDDKVDLKLPLKICEHAMVRINTDSSQLDARARKPLLQGWVRCKQFLKQTIGSLLELSDSKLFFNESLSEKCCSRIKALVLVEGLRFSKTSKFKDPTIPQLSEILELLESCDWLPESESKASNFSATVDRDSLSKDLLLALELHVLFSDRASEEEQTTTSEAALTEAFRFSEMLLSGELTMDGEMCQKFKLLMSHAHLLRGRNLVTLATTSSNATAAAATSAARATDSNSSSSDDAISGDGDDAFKRSQVAALRHFVHSARYSCEVERSEVFWSAVRSFCNHCLKLFQRTCQRKDLKDQLEEMLALVQGPHWISSNVNNSNVTKSKTAMSTEDNKKKKTKRDSKDRNKGADEKMSEEANGDAKSPDADDDDDAVFILNNLLYRIYAEEKNNELALKLLEHGARNIRKAENKKRFLRSILYLRVTLGLGIASTMVKFQAEDETMRHDLWMSIARKSQNPALQTLAYHTAIETLTKEENDWLRFESILEFAQWLHCKGHQVQDVHDLLEWASQIVACISSREMNEKAFKKCRDEKFKDNQVERSSGDRKEGASKQGKVVGKVKDEEKEEEKKEEKKDDEDNAEDVVIRRLIRLDLQSRMVLIDLETLDNVVHLEALLRCYVVTAMTSEQGSKGQMDSSLMCYRVILRIWKLLISVRSTSANTTAVTIPLTEDGKKKSKKNKEMETQSPKDSNKQTHLPSALRDWSTFSIPTSLVESVEEDANEGDYRALFPKPNLTVWYLLEISKVFEQLMLTPFLFPCLSLVEVVSKAHLSCPTLVNFVHLKLLDASIELNVEEGIAFQEQTSCVNLNEQDLARLYKIAFDQQEGTEKECTGNKNNNSSSPGDCSTGLVDLADDVDILNLFIDFARLCNKMCLYKPAHVFLHHVLTTSQMTNDARATSQSQLELAKVFLAEKNFSMARESIERFMSPGTSDVRLWLTGILVVIETYIKDNSFSEEDKIKLVKDTLDKHSRRICRNSDPNSEYARVVLEVAKCKNEFKAIDSQKPSECSFVERGKEIVQEMERLANQLVVMNRPVESAQVWEEGANYLDEISKDESLLVHQKHQLMLRASSFYERGEQLLEQQLESVIECLKDAGEINAGDFSLPMERMLSSLKLRHARLLLEAFEVHVEEGKVERCEMRRRNSIDKLFQELVPEVVECSGSEVDWKLLMRVITDKIFSKLSSVQRLCINYKPAMPEIFFLYGRLFNLVSQQTCHNFPSQWDVYSLQSEPTCFGFDTTNFNKYQRYSQHIQRMKKEASESNEHLVKSTEFLLRALYLCRPRQIALQSEISLQLVECLGQHDPNLSSHFLLYYQSCEGIKCLESLTSTFLGDPSTSEVAALYNQMSNLGKEAFVGNSVASPLYGRLDAALREKMPAWKKLEVSFNHLRYIEEYPQNCIFASLVHSPDRKHIYGTLVHGAQRESKTSLPKTSKEKLSADQQNSNNIFDRPTIVKVATSPERIECLRKRWRTYRVDLKENLLRQEMRIYAYHVHHKIVSSDKDETTILEQEFFQVLDLIEDYLEPVTRELRFMLRRMLETGDIEPETEPHPSSDLSRKTVILLADRTLLEFPLEGLRWLRGAGDIGSMARDISMNTFHRRTHEEDSDGGSRLPSAVKEADDSKKGKKRSAEHRDSDAKKGKKSPTKEKPQKKPNKEKRDQQAKQVGSETRVDANAFKYLVDPYNDAALTLDSNPTEVFKSFLAEVGKLFVPQWKGYSGEDVPPSKGEVETLVTKPGSGMFFTFEVFGDIFAPRKIAATNLSECKLMLTVDSCQSGLSYNRQLRWPNQPSSFSPSDKDDPVSTALLLSLSGVSCVVQNQWFSSISENSRKFVALLRDLFVGNHSIGAAMMLAMNPQMRLLEKARSEHGKARDVSKTKKDKFKESKTTLKKPKDKKQLADSTLEDKADDRIMTPNFMAVFHKKELTLTRSMFNTVCYGVPDLVIKTGK